MDDPINGDDQLPEAEETLSLTDFPISQPHAVSAFQDHRNPPSSAAGEDFFEFFSGGLSDNSDDKTMSHAEDIIFCGKLVPIEAQLHRNKPPETGQTLHRRSQQKVPNQPIGCRRSRSESTAEIKRTTTNQLVRNSRSLDYKKMKRNSSVSSEFTAEMNRDGSGKKSSSSRWYVLLFGLVKVPPPEMDIRDIKNRQVRRSSSKAPSESFNLIPVTSVDHRKCSWRVLGFLSCKSSSSAAVTTPVGYMPKA
ncbi:hypothetical protein SSX86_006480 [Deinandra increscens subsp. villosa]|uniref:Uncharacterized protein n=1 Tax=Deinandra increscens subsp. villosa TaxID=3103831 RepID=A0AAP0DEX4_9ASTR